MTNTPVQLLGTPSITGFSITNNATTPNTQLDIGTGQALASDGVNYITLNVAETIDFTTNGVNGLDAGTMAASTWYFIFAIGSSTNSKITATLASTNASNPTLPYGYDIFKLIGHIYSDNATHLLQAYWAGNGSFRTCYYKNSVSVLVNGQQTVFSNFTLANAVPPIQNTLVHIQDSFSPASAGQNVSYFPADSGATIGAKTWGPVASQFSSSEHRVLSRLKDGVAQIAYINSAPTCNTNVYVMGYDYYL